jgi:sterol desaturase/sphingolipid hydroxylase (fatty acid hydroxylase superfamily)
LREVVVLDELVRQLHDPIRFAIPVFVLFIGIELLSLRLLGEQPDGDAPRGYEFRDARASLLMGLGSVAFGIVVRAASLLGYAVLYELAAPWRLPASSWTTWAGLFVLVDLLWYAYHRVSHRVRLVWAAHQAHHSSEYFNFSTALRQKWNQWFETIAWVPLPLLGFPPWLIYTAFSANLVYQFFLHTERIDRLPRPVEFVFNTPSHHRVHHGSEPLYLDRNYGGILIIWDRLFGTFQPEIQRPTYGLTTPVNTYNILRLQFHEYAAILRDLRSARAWRERLGFVLGPPGWRPERSQGLDRAVAAD